MSSSPRKALIVVILTETADDVWTEVARGRTQDELLGQLREYFLKDDEEPTDEQESTGPPVFMIHVDGENEDDDQVLINYSLEDVATTAAEQIQETTTSEREEYGKEIAEMLREARDNSDSELETTELLLMVA